MISSSKIYVYIYIVYYTMCTGRIMYMKAMERPEVKSTQPVLRHFYMSQSTLPHFVRLLTFLTRNRSVYVVVKRRISL